MTICKILSADLHTGTTRQQTVGQATYLEILNVVDIEFDVLEVPKEIQFSYVKAGSGIGKSEFTSRS
jgi:hypothetical protein